MYTITQFAAAFFLGGSHSIVCMRQKCFLEIPPVRGSVVRRVVGRYVVATTCMFSKVAPSNVI